MARFFNKKFAQTFQFLALFGIMVAAVLPVESRAKTIRVSPGPQSLTEVLENAQNGDTILLSAGVYLGSLIIDKSIILQGENGATIDGQGQGHTIKVLAQNAVIRGLHIRNSGQDLSEQDSGIFIHKTAHNTVVENNFLQDNLIGIYLWGPKKAIVRNNRIEGLQILHINDRGNGIQLWNTPGSIIEGNTVRFGRDGIFTTTSKNNTFRNNSFENTRFAIHYMYTNNSVVSGNVSRENDVGFALMFSKKLKVTNNHSIDDNEHGFALNYANSSIFEGNSVKNGGVKCVFIYNSNKNIFKRNRFEGCEIGIHFTAGSEQNSITENAFILGLPNSPLTDFSFQMYSDRFYVFI